MEILDILNNLGNHKEEIAFAGFCLTSGIAATFASIVPSSFIFSELAKKNSKKGEEKTAILMSYQNPIEKFRGSVGIGPIAYYFSKKGGVKIINKAKRKDLEEALSNKNYENIIINGHGYTDAWLDSNGLLVDYSGLKTYPKEIIMQLTCGDDCGDSLVDLCAKNKEESYYPIDKRDALKDYFLGMKLLFSNKKQ